MIAYYKKIDKPFSLHTRLRNKDDCLMTGSQLINKSTTELEYPNTLLATKLDGRRQTDRRQTNGICRG